MKNTDYILIQPTMVKDLRLSGNRLIIYALIHGFCKDGEHVFSGSINYICEWTNLSKNTVISVLKSLVVDGLIAKKESIVNNVKFCSYSVRSAEIAPLVQNSCNNGGEKIAPKKNNDSIEYNREEKKKNTKEKEELFETCWKAYRRKGVKKTAKSQWDKLNDEEKSLVLPHIKHYVATREVRYQKDFERYLRDKLFNEVVYNKNKVAYDPQKALSNEYIPQGHNVYYDELRKFYYYTGFYMKSNDIFDGYNDEDRPDGAKLCLNNARGVIQWNANKKEWIKV